MAGRSKKQRDPEIQHLSELAASELPQVVWEFLVTETGQQETAIQLPPKKLRDYAGDFLDSEEGRFYWPLSDLQQWQYPEATHADVKKWIGELMIRERKRREAATSTITVDDRQEDSGRKKEKGKAPVEGPNALHKMKSSSGLKAVADESVHGAGTVTASPKKDPVTPTRRAKSPTVAPDVPYEELSQAPFSASKKRLKATHAAVRIASEKAKSTEKSDTDSITHSESRSGTLGLGLSRSPTLPRKRPADSEAVAGSSPPSFASPEGRSTKKVALSPSAPLQENFSPQPPFFGVGEFSTVSTLPGRVMMPPPVREQNSSSNHPDSKASEASSATVTVLGLQFSMENLARVPERVLEYITECVHHHIRLANRTDDPHLKDGYRTQSTLLQNLHADLESRVKCLAQDAEEKQWVESSHCLWKE